jgi:hypothetical protein
MDDVISVAQQVQTTSPASPAINWVSFLDSYVKSF